MGSEGSKCRAPDCQNKRINHISYCASHKCLFSDYQCSEIRVSENYCRQHKCGIFGCESRISEKHFYCDIHICSIITCIKSKMEDDVYCEKHENHHCVFPNCFFPIITNKRAKQKQVTCPTHTCNIEDCFRICTDSSRFCISHKCKTLECNQIATKKHGFCRPHNEHECDKTNVLFNKHAQHLI